MKIFLWRSSRRSPPIMTKVGLRLRNCVSIMFKVKIADGKKKNGYIQLFFDSLVNVCANTTAHAIPNIIHTCETFIEYFQYPFTVHLNVYEKDLVDFPAVSICNLNPFDTSKPHTLKYIKEKLAEKNLSTEVHGTDDLPALYQVRQAMKVLKASEMYDRDVNKSFLEYDMGFKLDDMLISCYFNGERCDTTNFTTFFTFEYGNCFTYNKNDFEHKIHKTSRSGPNSGLTLELFTGFPGKQDLFLEKKGLYIVVHNNSYEPDVKFEGMKLPVGFSADVSVHRYFYNRLGPPYGSCKEDTSKSNEDDPEFYKATIALGLYSRRICLEICIQNLFIIPRCNCSDPSIPIVNNSYILCHTMDEINCIDKVRNELDTRDLSIDCDHECPVDCNKIDYEISTNFADYPSEYYFHTIENQPNLSNKFKNFGNLTYSNFKQSVILLNVFYKDLAYSFLQEIPSMHFADAIGIIGGQIGLFLGCSVLTFFEPLEVFIEVCYKLLTKPRKNIIQVKASI
ncbi:unnamed protein product [Brachionus calyciflorus]|uniref:Uncharacterized protein n=1 Tax=Brachionus calyciflorus TaxID=104777 RepID=A0A814H2G5_9BILA|nr:unnamed protein product [Brachionus calyciflorus]